MNHYILKKYQKKVSCISGKGKVCLTLLVVAVHDREGEHAPVAVDGEGNLDHGRQVVEEVKRWPVLVHARH